MEPCVCKNRAHPQPASQLAVGTSRGGSLPEPSPSPEPRLDHPSMCLPPAHRPWLASPPGTLVGPPAGCEPKLSGEQGRMVGCHVSHHCHPATRPSAIHQRPCQPGRHFN